MKMSVAKGKSRMAGKLASTCTTGWAKRDSFGLIPIFTPTGTQMSVEMDEQDDHPGEGRQSRSRSGSGKRAKPRCAVEVDQPDDRDQP
jgi:hypothetical protein